MQFLAYGSGYLQSQRRGTQGTEAVPRPTFALFCKTVSSSWQCFTDVTGKRSRSLLDTFPDAELQSGLGCQPASQNDPPKDRMLQQLVKQKVKERRPRSFALELRWISRLGLGLAELETPEGFLRARRDICRPLQTCVVLGLGIELSFFL